jgi:hypothetical protein
MWRYPERAHVHVIWAPALFLVRVVKVVQVVEAIEGPAFV